jgi:hypothetical protein
VAWQIKASFYKRDKWKTRLIGSRGQQNVIKIGKKNSDTVLWIKNYNKNAIGFILVCF